MQKLIFSFVSENKGSGECLEKMDEPFLRWVWFLQSRKKVGKAEVVILRRYRRRRPRSFRQICPRARCPHHCQDTRLLDKDKIQEFL